MKAGSRVALIPTIAANMKKDFDIPAFLKRLARSARNLAQINQLTHKVSVLDERLPKLENKLNAIEKRLGTVEFISHHSQQRLDAIEILFNHSRSQIDGIDKLIDLLQKQIDELEASSLPTLEKRLLEEIHSQIQAIRKREDQERLFHPLPVKRPRLAFVSPLPPERSGISDYSAELLPELARYYDVEIITTQPIVSTPWINAYCPIRTVSWFEQHASDYARIVYQFGNSPFHSHMFALSKQYPGVVVLHDFFLSNVLAYEENRGAMPGVWTRALYRSHGYLAVQASFANLDQAINTFPCNLDVLQHARTVIVHSRHARQLACQWYGPHAADNWEVIPLLRAPAVHFDRLNARRALGIDENAFVLSSFGFIDPVKDTHKLLNAWLASRLKHDPNCHLVLVGANHPGEYGSRLLEDIRKSGCQERIRITGWVDDEAYAQYLQATDISVQLRSLSRGETSAAVLQCMNYGVPTIVNPVGSMAELPGDAVWKLPETFNDESLVAAIETLWSDETKRSELGSAAMQFVHAKHSPSRCASRYADVIEAAYVNATDGTQADKFSPNTDAILPNHAAELQGAHQPTATSPAQSPRIRQLLIDVSSIAKNDLQTGIERVVRAQLSTLLRDCPAGFRIEPVYLSSDGGAWHYRYARQYMKRLLSITSTVLEDDPVEVAEADIFYSADYFPSGVAEAAMAGVYALWRLRGVEINFLVFDLLPVLNPTFFPDGADQVHQRWLDCIVENADRLICISHAVAAELKEWIAHHKPARQAMVEIHGVHLGADIQASVPSLGLPEDAVSILDRISAVPSVLMVGTIEPRKGYLQTLLAFEQLWKDGRQLNLVIVGKEGWLPLPREQRRTIPDIVDKLKHHPELGKRLFWLEGISDEYLEKVYSHSTCFLCASEGEGFGLPIIEAARHGLPVIVRDLPVFREIAGTHAFYFSGLAPDDLSSAIDNWVNLHEQGNAPELLQTGQYTWTENARKLTKLLIGTQSST